MAAQMIEPEPEPEPEPDHEETYSLAEVAEGLGVTPATVARWVSARQLRTAHGDATRVPAGGVRRLCRDWPQLVDLAAVERAGGRLWLLSVLTSMSARVHARTDGSRSGYPRGRLTVAPRLAVEREREMPYVRKTRPPAPPDRTPRGFVLWQHHPHVAPAPAIVLGTTRGGRVRIRWQHRADDPPRDRTVPVTQLHPLAPDERERYAETFAALLVSVLGVQRDNPAS